MFTFIVGVLGFFFLINRINQLEKKVDAMGHKQTPTPAQPVAQETATPTPMSAPLYTAPAMAQIASTPVAKTERKSEFELGTKLFTSVGVIALLIGVGFFLRYAFENDLITETMRIVLGGLLGIVVAAVGLLLRKKYTTYGLSLLGAGLGILYVDIYAAYNFYNMISTVPAFGLLVLVSAIGIAAALALDSLPLISFSLAGSFLVTFLMPLAENIHGFFLYILVLNAVILVATSFKRWPQLLGGGVLASFLLIVQWITNHYNVSLQTPTVAYLVIFFGVYALIVIRNFLQMRSDYKEIDGVLLPAVPIGFILCNLTIFRENRERAILLAALGIVYAVGSFVVRAIAKQIQQEDGEGVQCSNIMFIIGSFSIAAAIAYHFNGSSITYLWAMEALCLIAVGSTLKAHANRIVGLLLSVLAMIRMFVFDFRVPINADAVFNSRSILALVMTIVFVGIYAYYIKNAEKNIYAQDEYFLARLISLFGAFTIPLVWMSTEIIHFVSMYENSYLSAAWLMFALLVFSIGIVLKENGIRVASLILMALGTIFGFIDSFFLNIPHALIFNRRVAVLGIVVLVLVCVYKLIRAFEAEITQEEIHLKNIILSVVNVLVIMIGGREISDYYNAGIIEAGRSVELSTTIENTKRVVLSAFLLAYGGIALVVGIILRSYYARVTAFLLFAISVFKIFLYDTANLGDVYKFISFISLGVILLLAGFAYYRFKDRITMFGQK